MLISWNTVIFKICSIFATDERRIVRNSLSLCLGGSRWTVFLLLTRINGLPQNTTMKGHSQHNPSLIGRKNQAKFEKDCVLTNGHRINITQSNLMILVSFSSAGVAWIEDVKRYGTSRSQATENPPFRFLWDTRYSSVCPWQYHWSLCRYFYIEISALPLLPVV